MADTTYAQRIRRMTILGGLGLAGGLWLALSVLALNPQLTDVGDMFPGNAPTGEITPEQSFSVARRAATVFQDAQMVWAQQFRSELGRVYQPAELVYFTRETPSACAGALNAAGPFYCAMTRTATLDLAFLGSLEGFLHRHGNLGAGIFVARVMATHAQAELGSLRTWEQARRGASRTARRTLDLRLALEADCLAGVWVAHARDRVGRMPTGLYGHMIATARDVERYRPSGSVQPDATLLTPGTPTERGAAFSRGAESGLIRTCIEGA